MISGSVIIEQIFGIPGMGSIAFQAILTRDYPIVLTVLMISSTLTIIGILVADIIYALVDPENLIYQEVMIDKKQKISKQVSP